MSLICYIYYADAVNHVFLLIARLQRQMRIAEVVVVYNNHNLGPLTPPSGARDWRVLPYDGTDWEFGAYQLGLDHLSRTELAGVLVLNDTAGRNYPLFDSHVRELARICEASSAASHGVLAGKLESQGLNFEIRGLAFDSWIRSNIFFLNRAGLEALSWRLFDAAVFTAPVCAEGVVATGGVTSAMLESHIANWLGAGAGKQGWRAHAGRAAVQDSLLARKAGSILLEKYLSARVAASGGRLLGYDGPQESGLDRLRVRAFYLKRRLRRWFN
jgi:hypothetical protein